MEPEKRKRRFADMLDMRDFHQVLVTCHADKNAYFRYMMGGLGNRGWWQTLRRTMQASRSTCCAKMVAWRMRLASSI
jgi:hypothetical protein